MAKTALEQWDETADNNTDRGGVNIGEGCSPSGINNAMRELMAQVAKWLGDDTVASATTADLGAVPGRYVEITGTTTITGFGTIKAGTIKFLKFSGALTLTHNGTSLILPGAANIVTAAGDTAVFVSEGSGNWRCLSYQRSAFVPANSGWEQIGSRIDLAGKASQVWTDLGPYRELRIIRCSATLNTSGTGIAFHLSSDNGASYYTSNYQSLFVRNNDSVLRSPDGDYRDQSFFGPYAYDVGVNSEGISLDVEFGEFNQAQKTNFHAVAFELASTGVRWKSDHAGRHQSAAAMNALRMQATGSTFAGGTVVLEGRRG